MAAADETESGDSPDDYGGEEDEFATAVREAFPDSEWDEDRLAAFKEAIRICVQNDEGGSEPKPKGKGVDLAIVFGGPKRKKG